MPRGQRTTGRSDQLRPLPATIGAILDAVQIPVPSATLRALATVAALDRDVTAEQLGRLAAHEQDAYLRSRETPRFAWALDADGVALRPRIWARGSWPLARRIVTSDSVTETNVTLALFLAQSIAATVDSRSYNVLDDVASEAAMRVLGTRATAIVSSPHGWDGIVAELAARQHPIGPAAPLASQRRAAERLEQEGVTGFGLYFGVTASAAVQHSEGMPPRLRLPEAGERGVRLDDLVRQRAPDPDVARDVLAYVLEWGWLTDTLGRAPTALDYAERWQMTIAGAKARSSGFQALFPGEIDPTRIWRLLWSGAAGGSVARLIGRRVVESEHPPTVVEHFVRCLAERSGTAVRDLAPLVPTDAQPWPEREQRRFFALCERALRVWGVRALLAAQEPERAQALLSLGGVFDEDGAAYAMGRVDDYRRGLPDRSPRRLLLALRRMLRVAAALTALDPPPTTGPYLDGVAFAANALAEASDPAIDLDATEEAKAVVRLLGAVR